MVVAMEWCMKFLSTWVSWPTVGVIGLAFGECVVFGRSLDGLRVSTLRLIVILEGQGLAF